MANKTRIEFEGFDEAIARLSQLEGDVKGTTEQALKKSNRYVRQNIGAAMQKHNRTYETIRSLISNPNIEWVGTVASMDVGFDLSNGGLPSIFLMYGTPRMNKDQNLYNAIYGKKTKDEIMKLQEEIFFEAIRKAGG